MDCEYAYKNKFGKLNCKLKEEHNKDTGETKSPLCPYQKYCGLSCEWKNNNQVGQCTVRRSHGKRV